MPFDHKKVLLTLSAELKRQLEQIIRSRTESVCVVERAENLLIFANGLSVDAIAERLNEKID